MCLKYTNKYWVIKIQPLNFAQNLITNGNNKIYRQVLGLFFSFNNCGDNNGNIPTKVLLDGAAFQLYLFCKSNESALVSNLPYKN